MQHFKIDKMEVAFVNCDSVLGAKFNFIQTKQKQKEPSKGKIVVYELKKAKIRKWKER